MSEIIWDGKGLPPVGAHLETTWGYKACWHECVILPKNKIAIDRHGGWHVMDAGRDFEFRSIKSERDKAIETIARYIVNSGTLMLGNGYKMAEFLYDAGYRKVEQ